MKWKGKEFKDFSVMPLSGGNCNLSAWRHNSVDKVVL